MFYSSADCSMLWATRGNSMKKRAIKFSEACLAGLVVLISGCGSESMQHSQPNASVERLPADLLRMQGKWSADADCPGRECEVVFSGYKIRIRYAVSEDVPLLKRNACIKKVDGELHAMLVYGDDAPWYYHLDRRDGMEILRLRFYNAIDHEWVHVNLARPENRDQHDAVAGQYVDQLYAGVKKSD